MKKHPSRLLAVLICGVALAGQSARAEVLLPPSPDEARALGSRVLDPATGRLEIHIDRLSTHGKHFKASGIVVGAHGWNAFEAIEDLRGLFPRTVDFEILVAQEGDARDCGIFHREILHVTAKPAANQRARVVGAVLTVEHSDENCGIAGPLRKSLELGIGESQ